MMINSLSGDTYCSDFQTTMVSSFALCQQFASNNVESGSENGHNVFMYYFEISDDSNYNCASYYCSSIETESSSSSTVIYYNPGWTIDNDCFDNLNTLGKMFFFFKGRSSFFFPQILQKRSIVFNIRF